MDQANDELSRKLWSVAAELEKTKSELENANSQIKALTDEVQKRTFFIAITFHRLRNPLNAMLGLSDLLRSEHFGPLGQRNLTYACNLHGCVQDLLSHMNDISDIVRQEAGKFQLVEDLVNIDPFVDETLCLVPEDPSGQRILTWSPGTIAIPRLYCDPRLLRQTLLKVIEAAPCGAVDITIDVSDGVTFIIRDTGGGIRPDDMAHVLTLFGERTGLALPVAKAVMEAHGGALELDNEWGVGKTVRLRFPPTRSRGPHSLWQ